MFHGKTDILTRGLICSAKQFEKTVFPKKIKMKITNDPKLHFYEERSTERQILLLEV